MSLPRLRPCAGGYTPTHPVSDRDFIQLICAFRVCFPQVGLVLSTREPAPLRDALLPDPVFALDRVVEGRLAVPRGPGLGIAIDEAVLARHPYRPGGTYAEVFPDHERARARDG